MSKNINMILENLVAMAILEKLTPEQKDKLVQDAMRKMLTDTSIDPRTKTGIREVFKLGAQREHTNMAYKELSDELKKVDPTPNGSYVNFMLRMYSRDKNPLMLYVGNNMREYLTAYEELKNRNRLKPPHNDINSFKDILDFFDVVDDNKSSITMAAEERGESKTVYEDDEVTIVMPLDSKSACRYGKDTKWCISALIGNQFDAYTEKDGPFLFLIPKHPEYPKEKYAIQFHGNLFVDSGDLNLNMAESITLLEKRFGNLVEKYFKTDEWYLDWAKKYK